MSTVAIVIPARFASSRFPGKPLALLKGATGVARTLLARSIAAARLADVGADIFVATDDERIAAEAERYDAPVIMTDPGCRNGTERVAQAVDRAAISADVIVNFQGDAPLTPPWFVEDLVSVMLADDKPAVATPILLCERASLEHMLRDRAEGRIGATTAVISRDGHALYFSKEILPYGPDTAVRAVYHHVGLYAYRRDALKAYVSFDQGPLELCEGLEQLRFLENGWAIRAVEVESRGRSFWELNNPSDVALLEDYFAAEKID